MSKIRRFLFHMRLAGWRWKVIKPWIGCMLGFHRWTPSFEDGPYCHICGKSKVV